MNIDKEIINYLSKLSKIELEEKEKEKFLTNLNDLEKLVSAIKNVNTDGVSENFEILKRENTLLRRDLTPSPQPQKSHLDNRSTNILSLPERSKSIAPKFKNNYFVVPKVVE